MMAWKALLLLLIPVGASAEDLAVSEVPGFSYSMVAQMGAGLAFIVALIYLLAWVSKKLQGSVKSNVDSLKIVGGLALGTRERLVLVQVYDTQVLIGVAPGQVSLLHECHGGPLTDQSGQNTDPDTAGGFSPVLRQFADRMKNT